MNTEESTPEAFEPPTATLSSAPRPSLLVVVVLVIAITLGISVLLRNNESDEPLPVITTQASDISPESHSELAATLTSLQKRLQLVEQEVYRQEASPWAGQTVSKARAEEIVHQVDALESVVRDPASNGIQLRQSAFDLDNLWHDRFRALRDFLQATRVAPRLPQLPPKPSTLMVRFPHNAQVEAYYQDYVSLQERIEKLASLRVRAFDSDLSSRAERVKRITLLRFSCLQRLSDLGATLLVESPTLWWQEVRFELHTYPTRKRALFYLILAKYRQSTGGGTAWGMHLAFEAAISVLELLFLVLALGAVQRRTGQSPPHLGGALPWVGIWALALGIEWQMTGGLCEALRPLASLAAIFARYRAYLQIAEGPLLTMIANSALGQRVGVRTYARNSLRWLGIFFLIEGWTLLIVLAAAAPGLLLIFTRELFALFFKAFCLWGAWRWRQELAWALRHLLPGPLGNLAGTGCESAWLGWLIAPLSVPLLLLLALLYSLVRWINRFEWGRQISAQVLRRWMESASDGPGPQYFPLPDAYRQSFLAFKTNTIQAWDHCDSSFRQDLEQAIEDWLEGRSLEAFVVLHGPFGTGRSAVSEHLHQRFSERLEVVTLKTPDRLCTGPALLEWLAQGLGVSSSKKPDDIAAELDERRPTLVLVPEAHRLFLSSVEGFGAFQKMTRLMARHRRNLFWCPILPSQTMHFLQMALSGEAALSRALRFPRWTEAALREMILEHHRATAYPMHFSPAVMRAAEATPGASAEGHYFRILREISVGNPTLARDLWLASCKVNAEGQVVVGLPPRNPPSLLPGLPSAATFLLASLMRHGDLTQEEAIRSTGLPQNQVYLAWERCLEMGIFFSLTPQRACVGRRWLLDVSHYLKERNLLDGQ
ncbi:hypothetical protein IV102_23310 [bacterium]|nr:hypothetical protein [bacterium]